MICENMDTTNFTGVLLKCGNQCTTFPVYDNVTVVKDFNSSYELKPYPGSRWLELTGSINDLLNSQVGTQAGLLKISIHLFVDGSEKIVLSFTMLCRVIITVAYLIADLIAYLATVYKWQPKLKCLRIDEIYQFVNDNKLEMDLPTVAFGYMFAIQCVPDAQVAQDYLIVKQAAVERQNNARLIDYFNSAVFRGRIFDGSKGILIDLGGDIGVLGPYQGVRRGMKILRLGLIEPSELSQEQIDVIVSS